MDRNEVPVKSEFIRTPFGEHCAITMTEDGSERVALQVKVEPYHMNTFGMVHGGLLLTLLDISSAVAAHRALGGPAITLDLQTAFLNGGKGDLSCEAWSTHNSRRLAFCEAEVRDAAGLLIAKSSGRYQAAKRA